MSSKQPYELSIIVPIYNGEATIPPLIRAVTESASKLQVPYEIILVNDHSADRSETPIEEASQRYPFVKGMTLSRRLGQQIAVSAGMRSASGRYVLLMDGDLQNPPDEIPNLYRKIKEGYDIVYTRSKVRNHALDEFTSKIFWFILTSLLGSKMLPHQLMMRIMTAEFAENYNRYDEAKRAVAGITHDIGMRSTVVEIPNRKRTAGKSGYNLFSRFELFLDMALAVSNRPLNALVYVGGLTSFALLLLGLSYLIKHFVYDVPPGYSSVIISICFFGSVNIAVLGIIGRYLSNIYAEVRRRPLFFIQRKFNL